MRDLLKRMIPPAIRDPLGRWRRFLFDDIRRAFSRRPYPPRRLLRAVQTTEFLEEYIDVGRASARLVEEWLRDDDEGTEHRVLDFGCGCARTINFIEREQWCLHGCDIDEEAIEWCRRTIPSAIFTTNDTEPPLPFPPASFDAVYAISIFTHMNLDRQRRWFEELHRILRSDGVLLLTTMGERVRGVVVDPEQRLELREHDGVLFCPRGSAFNEDAAFHSPEGVQHAADRHFRIERYEALALMGFQDAYLLRRESGNE